MDNDQHKFYQVEEEEEGYTPDDSSETFAARCLSYVMSVEPHNLAQQEFLGDRVFNLYMSQRLCKSMDYSSVTGAFAIYTSNKVMTNAMISEGLPVSTDCQASDLEIACSVAWDKGDVMFIKQAVEKVFLFAIRTTDYNEEQLKAMSGHISKKMSASHRAALMDRPRINVNTGRDPRVVLLEHAQAAMWPKPTFKHHQVGEWWHSVASVKGLTSDGRGSSKATADKESAQRLLTLLSRAGH